jgi:tetratricopeptide (TPR) repeat protein
VRLLQGRLHQARGLARSLLPLGQAMGDRWGVAACRAIAAFADAELGHVTAALEDGADALDEFRTLGDRWGQSMALVARGAALRGCGRHVDAIAELQQAVTLSEEGIHPVTAVLALGVLGYCRLDLGDAEGAKAAADRAIAALSAMDLEPSALVGLRVLLAQAFRALGQLDEAIVLLRQAEAVVEGSLVFPRRQALAHLAGALREAGSPAAALRVIHQAFAVPAEDVRSRVVALRVLAQCLADVGDLPAADRALRQAWGLSRATEQTSEQAATGAALTVLSRPPTSG